MTGHGRWPMTCTLTPDGAPFFTGAYFPLEPTRGMPAFAVLAALVDAWTQRRDEDHARERRHQPPSPADDPVRALGAGGRRRGGRRAAGGRVRRGPRWLRRGAEVPPPWSASSCGATVGDEQRCGWPGAPWRRWPAAGSTTSSPVASPAIVDDRWDVARFEVLQRPPVRVYVHWVPVLQPRCRVDRLRDGIVPADGDASPEEQLARLGARRRLRRRGGRLLHLDARAADAALGDDGGTAAAACSACARPATSSAVPRPCGWTSTRTTSTTPGVWRPGSWSPASGGRDRRADDESWRPGTASPWRRWPRPGWCSTSRAS